MHAKVGRLGRAVRVLLVVAGLVVCSPAGLARALLVAPVSFNASGDFDGGWHWLRSSGHGATWTFDTSRLNGARAGSVYLVVSALVTNGQNGGSGYETSLVARVGGGGRTQALAITLRNAFRPQDSHNSLGLGYQCYGYAGPLQDAVWRGTQELTVSIAYPFTAGRHVAVNQSSVQIGFSDGGVPVFPGVQTMPNGGFESNLSGWTVTHEWYVTLKGSPAHLADPNSGNHESRAAVSNKYYFDGRASICGYAGVQSDNTVDTWEHGTRTYLMATGRLKQLRGVRLRLHGQKSVGAGRSGWSSEVLLVFRDNRVQKEVPLWVDREAPWGHNGNHRVGTARGRDGHMWDVYDVPLPPDMEGPSVQVGICWAAGSWRASPAANAVEAYVDGVETY